MASTGHTYGPSCLLQTASNAFIRRASEASVDPPKIAAQFFYCNTQPIDDPLSPVPPPSNNPAAKASKVPPRPFSVHDNLALEAAWLKLQKAVPSKKEAPGSKFNTSNVSKKNQEHINDIIKHAHEKEVPDPGKTNSAGFEAIDMKPESRSDAIGVAIGNPTTAPGLGKEHRAADQDLTLCDDPKYIPFDETMPVSSEEIGNDEFESGIVKKRRSWSPFGRKEKSIKPKDTREGDDNQTPSPKANVVSLGSSPLERDTSGTPFLRIPSRMRRSRSPSRSPELKPESDFAQGDGAQGGENYRPKHSSPLRPMLGRSSSSESGDEDGLVASSRSGSLRRKEKKSKRKTQQLREEQVAVGLARLHVVRMPSLKMTPIYWDPTNDISSVVRGTWFYRDTMWPVESDIANQIEEGYEYIKPWTPTYVEELNSCEEHGPEAELKIVHTLWPTEETPTDRSRPETAKSKRSLIVTATKELAPEGQERQQAIVVAEMTENKAAGVLDGFEVPGRLFAKSSIIYANGRDAQILKPNQLPSVSPKRSPLGNIRKGKAVGIPVVRGFDVKVWEKVHPPSKKIIAAAQARKAKKAIRKASTISPLPQDVCAACATPDQKPEPTDLVLVIHGIGQKLSERVESFNFTHNINSFRRQVNMELESDAVKPHLRQDFGCVMVLPINWRSKLKLEEGGPNPDLNHKATDSLENQFTLKDITAESLPAVRNLISDVMLDIPYYLSHHRAKMIEAVIHEANRVYRTWCLNNPGFHENGRVHIVAHSLGSVMALDVLSKQPTTLPTQVDFKSSNARTDIFEFDTKSLFFCGSPAGLFLLLDKAPLLPRKDRKKPDAEDEDDNGNVSGEAGSYGCLAVDNLYNVMHNLDPVAYRLNACVDVDYATSLQPASIPSATESWAQFIGSKILGPKAPSTTMPGLDTMPRRPTVVTMPSTVEMETHNFTKEEIAEKRMFLLNDNGQIDYTLKSGGGPEYMQYLNMLGAHSSYWIMQDFVRFLVVEIGRAPGKAHTLNRMKAVKKAFGKR